MVESNAIIQEICGRPYTTILYSLYKFSMSIRLPLHDRYKRIVKVHSFIYVYIHVKVCSYTNERSEHDE